MDPSDASALLELIAFTDALVEKVVRDWRSIARAMDVVLPTLAARLGADGAFVRTYGEDLALHTFTFPADLADSATATFIAENERDRRHGGLLPTADPSRVLVGQSLDVAGQWFGCAGFLFPAARAGELGAERMRRSLEAVCEQLDNYLYSLRAAREKHLVTTELAHALKNPVLSDGLAAAVRILAGRVNLAKLAVVLRADASDEGSVHLQVYEGPERVIDTMSAPANDAETRQMRAGAVDYLSGRGRALLDRFGFAGEQEEILIHGVQETTTVGKIAVSSLAGDFNTYDRELLTAFSDFICQRVVDFNKEYRTLARSFRPADVDRILRTHDYAERWLAPREREVAILFADVSGFTRVCEQILVDPVRIGRLVNVWGGRAVDLVWAHGGVFDKMVGDCVIGLFGPPFYDRAPGELLGDAIRAAIAIRDMTRALPEVEDFAVLRGEGLGVSAGVHLAPLFVGTFGPNDNFTGFSAGMNNTARLQAQASRDEVLVMDEAIGRLANPTAFTVGELRSAKAKNVAQPLRFRPVELSARASSDR